MDHTKPKLTDGYQPIALTCLILLDSDEIVRSIELFDNVSKNGNPPTWLLVEAQEMIRHTLAKRETK